MGKSIDRSVRTIILSVPSKGWENAALALTHQAKNLYNTATFLIRQINSAYRREEDGVYVRIEQLHPNQIGAIAAFNAMIETVNDKRLGKEDARFLPSLEERMTTSPLSLTLDVTLLDNVARGWADHDGDVVYRRLPAACAQQVVRSVIDVWEGSLSAMKDWAKNPGKYPDVVMFYTMDGDTLNLAMVGSHHDYRFKGKHLLALRFSRRRSTARSIEDTCLADVAQHPLVYARCRPLANHELEETTLDELAAIMDVLELDSMMLRYTGRPSWPNSSIRTRVSSPSGWPRPMPPWRS